ncbi:phosphate ABC transporter substrate-binding protein [candidate division KSB1 bacterium]|nr:phosphate ABC transporter substrate-binding protein [candidate division KSB1 bacterium]
MLKRVSVLLLVLALCFSQCAIFHRGGAKLRIKGSDTMAVLTQRWAESFMKRYPGISVHAQAGGTQTGIQALAEGDADICAASRTIMAEEMKLLGERYGKIGIEHLVGKDALIVYLHPQNPVKDLTLTQIKDIFTGKISNWQSVGGPNREIRIVSRSPKSGSHLYFREHVLDGEPYAASAETQPTTRSIVQAVSEQVNAIGYGGIAYAASVIPCRVNGIAASEENFRNDTYPIVRYLYLYTIDKPEGYTKTFIDWVLSAEGQQIVEQVGYLPLWRQ